MPEALACPASSSNLPHGPRRPRRHARARRRLRRQLTSRAGSAAAAPRSSTRPTSCSTRRCSPKRGRQHRAAPRDRAAAGDVPARRPAARCAVAASTPSAGSSRSSPRPGVRVEYNDLVVALGSVTRMPPARACASTRSASRTSPTRSGCATTCCARSSSPTPRPRGRETAHLRVRRRRVRGRRDDRRAPGAGAGALRRHPRLAGVSRAGPRRPRAADPRADSRRPCGVRGADAQPARHRDPHRDGARLGRRERRAALRRTPDRQQHGRVDGRREGEPALGEARTASATNAGACSSTRHWAGRRDARASWSLGDGAAVPNAATPGELDPADVPARAAPGPPARAQPRRHAAALPATARAARWPRSVAATASRDRPACACAGRSAGAFDGGLTTSFSSRSRRAACV